MNEPETTVTIKLTQPIPEWIRYYVWKDDQWVEVHNHDKTSCDDE